MSAAPKNGDKSMMNFDEFGDELMQQCRCVIEETVMNDELFLYRRLKIKNGFKDAFFFYSKGVGPSSSIHHRKGLS